MKHEWSCDISKSPKKVTNFIFSNISEMSSVTEKVLMYATHWKKEILHVDIGEYSKNSISLEK